MPEVACRLVGPFNSEPILIFVYCNLLKFFARRYKTFGKIQKNVYTYHKQQVPRMVPVELLSRSNECENVFSTFICNLCLHEMISMVHMMIFATF